MKDIDLGRRVIAFFILVVVIMHLDTVFAPMKIIYYLGRFDGFAVLVVVLGWLFVLINLCAAYGLFRLRNWGFGTTYAAIVYSTLIFGASYIPFFDWLFPARYASYAALMANIGVLTLLLSLQMMQFNPEEKKKPRRKK
jgi:hypothetical protein